MKLLRGNLIAQKILDNLAKKTLKLARKPELHIIACREDRLTNLYLKQKKEAAKKAHLKVKIHRCPRPTPGRLLKLITRLNEDADATGILVQIPLPLGIDLNRIIWAINPLKDVDGFQMRELTPPTPAAVLTILSYYGIDFIGKRVHIIGKGFLVGKPLSILLKKSGAKVTISDTQTPRSQLANLVSQADIIISACGTPQVIDPEWLGKEQVLIDVGTMVEKSKLRGDIYSREIAQRVKAITPVPGGVGPVAVAKLAANVYEAAIKQMLQKK